MGGGVVKVVIFVRFALFADDMTLIGLGKLWFCYFALCAINLTNVGKHICSFNYVLQKCLNP